MGVAVGLGLGIGVGVGLGLGLGVWVGPRVGLGLRVGLGPGVGVEKKIPPFEVCERGSAQRRVVDRGFVLLEVGVEVGVEARETPGAVRAGVTADAAREVGTPARSPNTRTPDL